MTRGDDLSRPLRGHPPLKGRAMGTGVMAMAVETMIQVAIVRADMALCAVLRCLRAAGMAIAVCAVAAGTIEAVRIWRRLRVHHQRRRS